MRDIKIITVSVLFLIFSSIILGGIHNQKREGSMCGIIFFKTQKLAELRNFYINKVGCELWMDQKDCLIFRAGNMLFGFCQPDSFFFDKASDPQVAKLQTKVKCIDDRLQSLEQEVTSMALPTTTSNKAIDSDKK